MRMRQNDCIVTAVESVEPKIRISHALQCRPREMT